jgi:hypothetical protein
MFTFAASKKLLRTAEFYLSYHIETKWGYSILSYLKIHPSYQKRGWFFYFRMLDKIHLELSLQHQLLL